MGVPVFFRWLSEKYPKIVQDVLEERVHLVHGESEIVSTQGTRVPFDSSRRPNPSGLECDNLYIDMNGIIHPCAHPENGPQPKSEEEMFELVCRYVDRLFRAIRPRRLLYLAIDGVAPRAKMNQQRARRFRAAQDARELLQLERSLQQQIDDPEHDDDDNDEEETAKDNVDGRPWDSNVITPGTPFMTRLAEFLRFYIRKRLAEDKAWRAIQVIFSDASVPGEGEHKIMAHLRLQRAQPGYNPNLVHVLHGLDADLIMLALATHEPHFYISREEVLFGRKSIEAKDQRQQESGFALRQKALDQAAGDWALQLPENKHDKPLQRISIPILREYLAAEFDNCLKNLPFRPSLERLVDDIVFLCFFVGNDFLPHLPSLDIRDGALDFLFNVYKRVLPSLGDFITKSGGNVNLSHVDVILQHVGAIEDYVFAMKHDNEQQKLKQNSQQNQRHRKSGPPPPPGGSSGSVDPSDLWKLKGRAARIMATADGNQDISKLTPHTGGRLRMTDQSKKRQKIPASRWSDQDNAQAAMAFKNNMGEKKEEDAGENEVNNFDDEDHNNNKDSTTTTTTTTTLLKKRKAPEPPSLDKNDNDNKIMAKKEESNVAADGRSELADTELDNPEAVEKDVMEDDVEKDDDVVDDAVDDDEEELEEVVDLAALQLKRNEALKEKVKAAQQKKLDEYARNVVDNVRLHESGWKDRYYTDKCKADDVAAHGGREHLFRSYVVGLVWVMKYYYDGCPSWKWYFPFHYAPFASDLRNIERFQNDIRTLELSKPFNPVEQLMAVLPSDSAHAIPSASRWLMLDPESPIIDFYPKDVPVDPNGKAMPWLWVVLLPFIQEDRLLDALMPTMQKWTKDELLCNSRGLDDGYLYIHHAHPLAQKLSPVVSKGRTAKDPKTRLTGAGFFGSVRPPLTNELYSTDEKVPLPSTAFKIEDPGPDGLFTDEITVNVAICVAFSEPPKLPHKSVLLAGARPLPPVLTEEDKRIRRPRLGRGGNIANMGGGGMPGGAGQSHEAGYGSMNVSQYERDVASRMGRSNQMYQAGMRTWGAMEPTPKQRRGVLPPQPPPQPPNPFMMNQLRHGQPVQMQRNTQQQPGNFPNPMMGGRPPNGYGGASHTSVPGGYGHPGHQPSYQQPQGQQQWQQGPAHQAQWQPQMQQQQHSQQQRQQQQHHQRTPPRQPYSGAGNNQYNRGLNPNPPPQQRPQEFSFRHPNNGAAPPSFPTPPQQQQQRSRANADDMQALRAQLSSTLRHHKSTPH